MVFVALDRAVDPLNIDFDALRPREVDQGATSRRLGPVWELLPRLYPRQLLGELDELEEVLLIVDNSLAALLNQGVEQSRHRLVVLRVHGLFVNDCLADVVDDRLSCGLRGLPDVLRQLVESSRPMLDNEVY